MKILLVEDDRELNRTLLFQLEKEGFLVDSCFDGEEACYYMQEGLYDLILLDRMLPKMDGIAVLEKIRREGNTVPVILLTALGTLTDKITGLDCGADDYLVKPLPLKSWRHESAASADGPGGWRRGGSFLLMTSAILRRN